MMLFPDALLNSPLFGIGLTVILYAISEIIIDRFSLNIIPPFVIACPLVIAVIVLAPGVEYKQYEAGAEFINFLLGPATIALALPLYKNREIIMAKAGAIAGGAETFLSKGKAKSLDAKLAKATKWFAIAFVILTLVLNLI